jgi:hypothetical protein
MEKEKYTSPAEDFEIVDFGDKRLNKRLIKSTEEKIKNAGKTRSSAKGFYRLLSNEKFKRVKLEEAMKKAAVERIKEYERVVLVQDWTNIDLGGHKKTKDLGYSSKGGKGIKLHSCLAVSEDGLPLGLLSQSYETRAQAKSGLNDSEKIARPIEEKESYTWIKTLKESIELLPEGVSGITVCDREGDIYELYEQAQKLSCDFVIRAGYQRNAQGGEKVSEKIRKAPALGYVTIEIPRGAVKNGKARKASMTVSSCRVHISKKRNSLPLNIVRIAESEPSDEAVEWILSTSLPVDTSEEVMRVVQYYALRWKIERFHYVLKSGCKAEEIQQRTYQRILPVILICSMIANFILALNYFARVTPGAGCDLFFEEEEWKLLYRFAKNTKIPPDKPYSLAEAVKMIGILGVGVRASSDGDYGVKAIWIGLKNFYSAIHILMGQV